MITRYRFWEKHPGEPDHPSSIFIELDHEAKAVVRRFKGDRETNLLGESFTYSFYSQLIGLHGLGSWDYLLPEELETTEGGW